MSIKRVLFVVLVASAVLLVASAGPGVVAGRLTAPGHWVADSVPALPPRGASAASVTIPYPGRLADEAGQPVADGTYDFSFALFGVETGGQPLWSEVQEGVAVKGGAFVTALGNISPISATVLEDDTRWLTVAVRGPGEVDFTALTPRQQLGTVSPAAPAKPSGGAACPHDHWGETWSGSGTGLSLRSTNADGVHGEASAPEKSGVFGSHLGSGYGVFGRSDSGPGVGAWSAKGDGVHGEAIAAEKSGVYGAHSGNGYGVFGRSNTGIGTSGWSTSGVGMRGETAPATGIGVVGVNSKTGNYAELGTGSEGVHAVAFNAGGAGVFAQSAAGPAVHADGDLYVTGAFRGNIGEGGAPFPRPAYDSGWHAIAKGGDLTFNHNLGGNRDDYVVDLQFKDNSGKVHNYLYGGMTWEPNLGAWWTDLTNTHIVVERMNQDEWVLQVRVRIWVYR